MPARSSSVSPAFALTMPQRTLLHATRLARHASTTARRPKTRMTVTASTTPDPSASPQPAPEAAAAYRLAPSDFAFLWQECRRCFYLKVHRRQYRPRAPFPSVFGTIDLSMKRHFRGLRTTDVVPSMPPGVFLCEDDDAWVESNPVAPLAEAPGTSVYVRGMVDALVRLDDGGLAVIDFKTSDVSPRSATTYSRQLHAYALALENPSPKSEIPRSDVPHLGLVVYSPNAFTTPVREGGRAPAAALTGGLHYVPIERDTEGFNAYLAEVAQVLAAPEPPPSPPAGPRARRNVVTSCPFCQYLHEACNCP